MNVVDINMVTNGSQHDSISSYPHRCPFITADFWRRSPKHRLHRVLEKKQQKKRNKKKQDSWTKCNTCLGKWALLLLARKSLEDKMMCEIR